MQVQLAKTYEQKRAFSNGMYSRKFDGKRMYYLDNVAYSRDNKVCRPNPIKHITEQIVFCPELADFVTDGEVLYFEKGCDETGHHTLFEENFKKAISLTSRIERAPECDNLCYVIFDIINTHCFETMMPDDPFIDNYTLLCNLLEAEEIPGRVDLYKTKLKHVYIARQTSDLFEMINHPDYKNWEGLMYRNSEVPYEYKRSGNLLNMKRWHTCECRITGYQEGLGKHEGRLGALLVDYRGYSVSVGSGFTDQEREAIWQDMLENGPLHKSVLRGETYIKVKYFEESSNAEGGISLRFPTYQCFRDKNLDEFTI